MKNYDELKKDLNKDNYKFEVRRLGNQELYHLVETDNWLLTDIEDEIIISSNMPELMKEVLIEQLGFEL